MFCELKACATMLKFCKFFKKFISFERCSSSIELTFKGDEADDARFMGGSEYPERGVDADDGGDCKLLSCTSDDFGE